MVGPFHSMIDWPLSLSLGEGIPHGRGAQQGKITDLFMPERQKRKRKELGSLSPLRTSYNGQKTVLVGSSRNYRR